MSLCPACSHDAVNDGAIVNINDSGLADVIDPDNIDMSLSQGDSQDAINDDPLVNINANDSGPTDVIDPDRMDIDVTNIEVANLDGAHFEDPNTTPPLTDAQFNMLFSYIRRALSASENENPPRTQMENSTFTMPAFLFIQQPSATSAESIADNFPHVPPDTIQEILHFEFFPPDLYKLDPISSESTKQYSTLSSLMGPLSVYFQIIGCYAASSNNSSAVLAVQRASLAYCAHLSSLNETYEWSAVLEYHSQFFFRRSREMARGDYSGWQSPDQELMGQLLFPHVRHPRQHSSSKPSLFFLGFLIFFTLLPFTE